MYIYLGSTFFIPSVSGLFGQTFRHYAQTHTLSALLAINMRCIVLNYYWAG